MKQPLAFLILCLAASVARADERPAPNTLTPEEKAAGYALLFDGQNVTGFRINGDFLIEDGVLIVGGPRTTTAVITTSPPRAFDLRLLYRVEGPGQVSIVLDHQGFLSLMGNSNALMHSDEPLRPDQWDALELQGLPHPERQEEFETTEQYRLASGEVHGGSSGWQARPGSWTISFIVPAGSKFHLRDVKLRADRPGWWQTPWPYVLFLTAGVLVVGLVGLLVLRRLRRRWAANAGFDG